MSLGVQSLSMIGSFLAGIYVAQNYTIPNIQNVFEQGWTVASSLEKKLRK